MKEILSYQKCSVPGPRGNELRHEIDAFNAEYCAVLDSNEVEAWPAFFTEDALYRIASREDVERDLPVGLVYCEGRDMMTDRAVAVSRTQMFAPRYMLHILSATRVHAEEGEFIHSQTGFILMQTLVEGPTTLHLAGKYYDRFVRSGDSLLLAERQVVYDTNILANDLVYPV